MGCFCFSDFTIPTHLRTTHRISSSISLMALISQPTVWFCCHCNDGPHSDALVSGCTNSSCSHQRCNACSTTTTDSHDMNSVCADSVSECSDEGCSGSRISNTLHIADYVHDLHEYTLMLNSKPNITTMEHPKPMPISLDTSTPLTKAALDSLNDTMNLPTTLIGENRIPETTGGYIWYCCQCDHGPWNCTIDAGCPGCQHWRCGSCTVTTTK
ncbi:hypothetical protein K491DRAFT_413432 [Lophiostoma macrostomum CBS 122681]|uniref:Uncharacterized protein n=1 Tax=Lophiostoma macrostomum CBS 122681 TaxID=1314788 RepID=A0A6A6T9N0_9PLEO|nr:hypothetical protein K491DRAFT_413432 [Lophiostoma macrostomum CBS 122681]